MLVVNTEGKILLGERFGQPGVWQLPQGGVDDLSDLAESVYRELNEELGIERQKIRSIKKLRATHEYDWTVPPEYGVGRWRGQSQTFWVAYFSGSDSDIALDRHAQEFSAYRWCTVAEVRQIAEQRRLPGYEAALKEFEEV